MVSMCVCVYTLFRLYCSESAEMRSPTEHTDAASTNYVLRLRANAVARNGGCINLCPCPFVPYRRDAIRHGGKNLPATQVELVVGLM